MGTLTPDVAGKQVLAIALAHQIVSSQTSLIAVDKNPKRPLDQKLTRAEVPVNLPAGWNFDKVFGTEKPVLTPKQRDAAADYLQLASSEKPETSEQAITTPVQLPQTATAFSRFFQREKVPEGRMRGSKLLNLLALLCLITDTPRPGNPGTSVLSAHRDTHFAFLKDVERGDDIIITRTDGLTFRYRVTNMRVAQWNTSGIDRHARGHHLVLSTCWPFDAVMRGNERYIVEAELVT